jgi:Fe-S-cluster containining protein
MGQSIWLDPYDIYNLTIRLGKTMEELMQREVELHVEDGLILPNIRMIENGIPRCSFLNGEGRCDIHAFRPGYCRLFPLGRNYEDGKLSYFVLQDACPMPNKSKQKIDKWLQVPRIKEYERFLETWHALTKGLRGFYAEQMSGDGEEAVIKVINMQFLQIFYMLPYEDEDFYPQFEARMNQMQQVLRQLGVMIE